MGSFPDQNHHVVIILAFFFPPHFLLVVSIVCIICYRLHPFIPAMYSMICIRTDVVYRTNSIYKETVDYRHELLARQCRSQPHLSLLSGK